MTWSISLRARSSAWSVLSDQREDPQVRLCEARVYQDHAVIAAAHDQADGELGMADPQAGGDRSQGIVGRRAPGSSSLACTYLR